jgi:hypothetical protein
MEGRGPAVEQWWGKSEATMVWIQPIEQFGKAVTEA